MTWILRDLVNLYIATPIGAFVAAFCLMFWDYFYVFPRYFFLRVLRGDAAAERAPVPSGLIVIPTLLRQNDELEALQTTISNVMQNDYPAKLLIVASIDGFGEAPHIYSALETWVADQQAVLPENVWLYLTGTPKRRGKPLAIERAVEHVKELVKDGEHEEFPKIYFSTDADADLGPRALEHIARRLCTKNPITGAPGKAVAGNLYVRGNSYWKGWRYFFTVEGQLSIQVAREYLVTNIARHNKRPFPLSGTTGVLYCMWTELFLEIPRFMGFMQTLKLTDWLKWWVGFAPPKFSESKAAPIPELMAGDTDDTVSAFTAILARWENGRFTLDAPRTPLHALYYFARSFLFERALRYEPEARVYTSSPTTIKTLWKQRVRWNTARIEVAGRFWSAFFYHWDLGVSAIGVVGFIFKYVAFGAFYYVAVPFALGQGSYYARVGTAFLIQLAVYALWTTMALAMNGELRKNWRLLLALPCAPTYILVFSFWTTFTGVLKDVFLFGNVTKFAPETTLIRGDSTRIALLARSRRFVTLLLRAAIRGDVPFGLFWFGWGETAWTPSEYQGWTSGKRPTLRGRLRWGAAAAAQRAEPALATAPALAGASALEMTPVLVASAPSLRPSLRPSVGSATRPSARPSMRPTRPSVRPSLRSTAGASTRPSLRPSMRPSAVPAMHPSVHPPLGVAPSTKSRWEAV